MDVDRTPNLIWRTFVVLGLGTGATVSLSDEAWERWRAVVGERPSRDLIRSIMVGATVLHAAEAPAAYVSARRAGLDRPGRWAWATLLWGFPVMLRLRKAEQRARG